MSVLYAAERAGQKKIVEYFAAHEPTAEIFVWPETGPVEQVEFAIVDGSVGPDLRKFPRLRAVQSTWAGINALLASPTLPSHIPFARMVAREMTQWMTEYIVFQVLDLLREGFALRSAQSVCRWQETSSFGAKRQVGILGFGELGQRSAEALAGLGVVVLGWSKSKGCHGADGTRNSINFSEFLAASQILVCLLPLTRETTGILNQKVFAAMPSQSSLIQVGRGAQLVESDLIQSLDSKHLARAILDVFSEEPLPQNHVFWKHPQITVTPHVAAISTAGMGNGLILENYRRAIAGAKLLHQVDRTRGY